MDKIRTKYAIFLIFPLHLGLMHLFSHGNYESWVYLGAVLLLLMIDFFLSFAELQIFTSRRNNVLAFGSDFIPYFLQKVLLTAVEWGLILLLSKGRFDLLSKGFDYGLAGIASTATMAVSALVTFVTGAGRTMLYHDEKR